MSAPAAMKAVSHREALSKTVRLLTRDGIDVQFRGHQPMVQTKGNKAFRLILPELNDSASPELLEAIQGFLDHEVGHIFYTPFARATKAGTVDRKAPALINIVEDIRLEKLLPRDLPGTRENLERMYDRFIPMMIHPSTESMVKTGDPSKMFAGVMVPAMRALAGQKAFQVYMDANGYWPHFMPLLAKMPDLARRLKAMETFNDVEDIVTDILAALAPPKPAEPEKEPDRAPPPPPPPAPGQGGDDDGDDDGKGDDEEPGDDGDNADGDDADGGDETDEDGGEGHGNGSGTDDGEGDEDDTDCSGDGDEDGGNDDRGATEPAEDGDKDLDKERSSPQGKDKLSITDALKQLDPTQRKALFMYKQRKQSVSEIATDMHKTEDEVLDLLRNARRKLGEIMKGTRA